MHIGIIGAGAAGVALLDALAATGGAPGAVTVFDGSPALWRGRPYQPDLEAVRVNAPPMIMSIRAGDPTHYQRWLGEQPDVAGYLDEAMGQTLVPRGRYGKYLEDTARAAIDELRRAGWRVSVVNARVSGFSRDVGVVPHLEDGGRAPVERAQLHAEDGGQLRVGRTVPHAGDGSHAPVERAQLHAEDGGHLLVRRAVLHTDDGRRVPVDRAVLAVGNGRPRDHYGLTGASGYVNEPYPLASKLPEVAADAHVAVIGSGLTAVDIAAGLAARGHIGPISFLSRSGTLPFVQKRPVRLEPRYLTPERVLRVVRESGGLSFEDLVALMRAELTYLGQDFDSFAAEILTTETEPPIDRLRRQLADVDTPHHGLRLLAMAIRAIGPLAWPLLNESDRTGLRGRHFRTINSLSSPMVPHNAKIMLRLLDSGQLRLRPGVTKIEARPGGGFTVVDETAWDVDAVVNAVNPPAYTTPSETEPLVSALLQAGAAEFHPAGGLSADPATRQLLVGGKPDPTWHVVGNLAADSMFIATNPPGLAGEVARLARTLVGG
ncbi:FAD-dependent oxidoreductase [Nocardia uniformis]|uniref:FAD-dependent oxidoreductase n=1 Tax=Nocardia uniformis TaxID=53432 RepID=A0A849CEZ3_9NOCA|nr:FAD/NAD(P)-binding protein [Nocardia uniformis]NNH74987.1 FAD-dependent oxidoreductase [Nocardia uniformis]